MENLSDEIWPKLLEMPFEAPLDYIGENSVVAGVISGMNVNCNRNGLNKLHFARNRRKRKRGRKREKTQSNAITSVLTEMKKNRSVRLTM